MPLKRNIDHKKKKKKKKMIWCKDLNKMPLYNNKYIIIIKIYMYSYLMVFIF